MKNVLFFHGTTIDGRRFTVAGKFVTKGKILKNETLQIGVALCSKKDIYVKKVGRSKAEGRLVSNHTRGKITIAVPKEVKEHEINEFIKMSKTFNEFNAKYFQKQFNLYNK